MTFISIRVRGHQVMHGFDADDRERLESVSAGDFVEKVIAVDRLLSATDKTLLVAGAFGRQYYWEYEGGLSVLKERLIRAGLLIE